MPYFFTILRVQKSTYCTFVQRVLSVRKKYGFILLIISILYKFRTFVLIFLCFPSNIVNK